MRNTEKRVVALETSALDDATKVIVIQDGETQAEALERIDLSPDALRVVCISPLDDRL